MIPYNSESDDDGGGVQEPNTGKWIGYEEFVCKLAKKMPDIKTDLVHMTLGISGEAGELTDAIKKHFIYNKELDRDNIVEELGDLEWYMAGMRQLLGISRQYVLNMNVEKLSKRYIDGGYSDAAAIARADKAPATPQLVTEEGAAIQPSNLQVLDVTAGAANPPREVEPVAGTILQHQEEALAVPMPDWLVRAITDDMLHVADVSAWNIHKNKATVRFHSDDVRWFNAPQGE